MSIRTALNISYAMLIDGRDEKQRRELDAQLYGWGAVNDRANQALMDQRDGGGEG